MKRGKYVTRKMIYEALESAERDFKLPPNHEIYTGHGLCWYFHFKFNFSDEKIDFILKTKGSTYLYMFCGGHTQKYLYKKRQVDLYNERSDWCAKRKLDFKKKEKK